MKISKVLFVSALATLMGVAAFTGVKVADVNKVEPVAVEAVTDSYVPSISYKSGEFMYVNASTSYFGTNTKCAVYFFNSDSDNTWSAAYYDRYDGNHYRIEIPGSNKTWSYFIVCRLNSQWDVPNWDGVWNQTENITANSSYNAVTITGWGSGNIIKHSFSNYTHYGLKSGEHAYFNMKWADSNWGSANAKYALYFFDAGNRTGDGWSSVYNSEKTSLSSSFVWLVQGQTGYNDKLYECIIPQLNGVDVVWGSFKAVRYNTIATHTGWDDVWNQSENVHFGSTFHGRNVIQKGGTNWDDAQCEEAINETTRIGWYANYFLSQVTCNETGSPKSINWNSVKNEYKQHLSKDVSTAISSTTGDKTGVGIAGAVGRYDYLLSKYGSSQYENFMSREVKPLGNLAVALPFSSPSTTAASTATAIVIAVAAIGTVGAFLTIKKKKIHK